MALSFPGQSCYNRKLVNWPPNPPTRNTQVCIVSGKQVHANPHREEGRSSCVVVIIVVIIDDVLHAQAPTFPSTAELDLPADHLYRHEQQHR